MSLSHIETTTNQWSSSRRIWQGLKAYVHMSGQWACGLLLPVALLALWQIASKFSWLPEQILPPPSLVALTTLELWQTGELSLHFAVSAERIFWSVSIGIAVGGLLGIWLAMVQGTKAYVLPSINLLSQFPIVGWIPLLMIFLGIDEALKISAISLAVIPPILIATYKSIQNVPVQYLEVAQVYQFSGWQRFIKVILPAGLPSMISGLRQGIMQAWLALVFVELLASSEGIGFLMVWGRQLMQMDIVFMGILLIGVTGYLLDSVLAFAERKARFVLTRVGG